jgi:hypothetical protein
MNPEKETLNNLDNSFLNSQSYKELLFFTKDLFSKNIEKDTYETINVEKWLSAWINEPNWSLKWKTPSEFVQEYQDKGLEHIKQCMEVVFSGAYL